MAQCRFALVPDGLFLSAMFGGDTLQVQGHMLNACKGGGSQRLLVAISHVYAEPTICQGPEGQCGSTALCVKCQWVLPCDALSCLGSSKPCQAGWLWRSVLTWPGVEAEWCPSTLPCPIHELRIACSVAHMERAGGVTPVVSPFA
ncbi:hypothetical protein HaLaN_14686, partial [Haematococcus lacustris]